MKDWMNYIEGSFDKDLWGLVSLDYYYRVDAHQPRPDPSQFIDSILKRLGERQVNVVSFHNVLVSICVQLLGSDFDAISEKSMQFLRPRVDKLSADDLQQIINHYAVYGKSGILRARIAAIRPTPPTVVPPSRKKQRDMKVTKSSPRRGVTKTVVEMDLVGYSTIGSGLEEGLDVKTVTQLNEQIQSFVDSALEDVGVKREAAVMVTTGDGAILVFDAPSIAHRFARAAQEVTQRHNRSRKAALAKRVFRIGAATGEIDIRTKPGGGFDIAGATIARAVRLEAKARPGGFLVDAATFEELPKGLREIYGARKMVAGKRKETFEAYACLFNKDGPKDASFFTDQAKNQKGDYDKSQNQPFGPDKRREVLSLFTRLRSHEYAQLIFLLEIPIGRRPPDTADLESQKAHILRWAEEDDVLGLLLDVLRDLTKPKSPKA